MPNRPNRLPILRLITLLSLACLVLVGISGSGSARAQAPTSETASAGSVLVLRLYYQGRAEYIRLANEFGLEEAQSPRGYLLLPADQAMLDTLRARGLRVEVDQAETQRAIANPPIFGHNPDTFYGGYHTVEEMQTFLDQKVAQYPTLAQKVDIGDSWCKTHPGQCTQPDSYNGYDMYAMRITNQSITGTKPAFWLNTGLHPRELVPPEISIRYINWLLDGYNTNADARWLVDWHEIWIMPMSNPDGHHIVENGESTPRTQRKNADKDDGCTTWPPTSGNQFGVDLNRNFPFLWGCCGGSSGTPCNLTYRGPAPHVPEDETQAIAGKVRELIPDQRGPNINDAAPITTTGIFVDMHSNARLTLYPWGQTFDPAPNSTDLRNIAKHMSAPSVGGNGYHMEQSVGLYPTDGASDDWEYGELGGPGFTIELASGGTFMPPYSVVETDWNANRNALIHLSKISRMPYLMTRGPDTNVVTSTPMTVTQGTPVSLTSTINYNWSHTDPPEANTYLQNVTAAEYYIDTPPWAGGTALTMTAVDGNYNSPTEAVQATVNTASLAPGRHVLMVRGRGVNDYAGYQSWGAISATFLDVLPGGGGTSTPTLPPTSTSSTTATSTSTSTSTSTAVTSGTPVTPPPTSTPTSTATSTTVYTSTPTPQASFTPGAGCAALFGTGSATCSSPTTYDYSFSFYNESGCTTSATGTASLTFEVAETLAGPFTVHDVQTRTVTFPPGPSYVGFQGTMTETNIPSQYTAYRIIFNATSVRQLAYVTTAPSYICTTATATPSATPTACALTFTDVPADHTFYASIRCLACYEIINGYASGCETGNPCFRPGNNVTRGQIAKIVSNAAGFNNPVTEQTFEDVPVGSTFHEFVERLVGREVMSGYDCGGPGEPCVAPDNRPYFRPNGTATRGQLAKIVSNAAAYQEPVTGQTFEDVPPGHTFYDFIERLATRGVMSGYACGGLTEPCVPPDDRPYFRPSSNVTRGQTSKIVANTFFPECNPPRR